jgi:hypothetical protein
MPNDSPFFIIGAGRSGTTLLRLILAGHPRLHITPETWFIRDLVRELPLTGELTPAQVDRAVVIMAQEYRWPDLEIGADHLRRAAYGLQSPRLVDVIDIVYREQRRHAGKVRVGDKTPAYIDIIPELATMYPGARFIHLIRDGRDVAISRIDLNWERYYERNRFEWTLAMARREEYLRSPYAGQILEVRYEDLVSEPAATVQQVCEFLGEEFVPGMLDWQNMVQLVPPRERHIHRRLTQPTSADAVAVWQRRLSAAECFAMEACLYRDLERLQYPLRFQGVGWRLLLAPVGWMLCTMAPALRVGVPFLRRHSLLPRKLYI